MQEHKKLLNQTVIRRLNLTKKKGTLWIVKGIEMNGISEEDGPGHLSELLRLTLGRYRLSEMR